MPQPADHRGWFRSTGAFLLLAAALVTVLTTLLHVRASNSDGPGELRPLPVNTLVVHQQTGYDLPVSHLGLVVAGRKADLGFERQGVLASLHVREGAVVAAGQVLASQDDRELRARHAGTVALLERVQAELELAQLKAQRQQDLSQSGAVSREAFDETRLSSQALEAQLRATRAELDSLEIALEKTQLRAPYAGTVGARYLDEGAIAAPGAPVLRLIETGRHEAHVGVPVSLAQTLHTGENYTLVLRDEQLDLPLRSLRPDVNPNTRTRTAVFLLPPDTAVIDGEAISLLTSDRVESTGAWLPLAALLEGERGVWSVFRIEQEAGVARAVREAVEVVAVRGDRAYVRGTVSDGQRVVASGTHRIPPGSTVLPLEP